MVLTDTLVNFKFAWMAKDHKSVRPERPSKLAQNDAMRIEQFESILKLFMLVKLLN